MSMLAEKRRKQKWLLNPQGKHWLADSNKFGLKVLESLGWKEGKGLGKHQDGITEPIKISYKNDNKGLGLKETQSSLQQDHFNDLLQSLNNSTSNNSIPEISSLEKKSQNSRSRVHYKKFTRGKDISRYSKKDLASIFEKKSQAQDDDNMNVNTKTTTNYFKKPIHLQPVNKTESESDDDARPGFGFNQEAFVNPAFEPLGHNFTLVKHKLEPIVEIDNEKDVSVISTGKKKKLKRNSNNNQKYETNNEYEVKRKTKQNSERKIKKRKKTKVYSDENDSKESKKHKGIDNPVLQLNDSVEVEHENTQSKPKKKKSGQLQLTEVDLSSTKQQKCGIDNPALEINPVNEKRKKKKANVDEQTFAGNTPELTHTVKMSKNGNDSSKLNETLCDVVEHKESENKRKKKNKGIANPAFNENDVTENTVLDIQCDLMLNVVEEPVKAVKQKSKKSRSNSTGCNNYGFDAKAQRIEENMTSISRTMEMYQAEVENDMNEQKDNEEDVIVGEFSNIDGENEKHTDGVLLRYKYAAFKKDPDWVARYNHTANPAKKSYKHLIRGDIAVGFKQSNLHEIQGYGVGNKL